MKSWKFQCTGTSHTPDKPAVTSIHMGMSILSPARHGTAHHLQSCRLVTWAWVFTQSPSTGLLGHMRHSQAPYGQTP